MNNFFEQIFNIISDKQEFTMKIVRVHDQLTILSTGQGVNALATATPEEMDEKFISWLQTQVAEKSFVFKIVEAPETAAQAEKKEEDDENDQGDARLDAKVQKKKGEAALKAGRLIEALETFKVLRENEHIAKKIRERDFSDAEKAITSAIPKVTKQADGLFAKKQFIEAKDKFDHAIALCDAIDRPHADLDHKATACEEFIAPPDKESVVKEEPKVVHTPPPVPEKKETAHMDPQKQEFIDLMGKGHKFYDAGQYQKAMDAFGDAKKIIPDDIEACSAYEDAAGWVKMENEL